MARLESGFHEESKSSWGNRFSWGKWPLLRRVHVLEIIVWPMASRSEGLPQTFFFLGTTFMVKVDSYSTSPADDHPARPRMCVIKNHPTCVHDPSIQEFRSRQAHCMPEPCLLVCWFDCSFACLLLVCHWGLRSFKICKNHCFFFCFANFRTFGNVQNYFDSLQIL